MAIPSIYINLEDDVSKIVARLKHNPSKQVVLTCPKRCFLFNDSINLRLLKKQTDLLGKEVFILTMDERGQVFAKEAGFQLKFMPKGASPSAFSDIRPAKRPGTHQPVLIETAASSLASRVKGIKQIAKKFVSPKVDQAQVEMAQAQELSKIEVTDAYFPQEEVNEPVQVSSKAKLPKIITGVVALSLIVLLLLVFVILPKATVVVYAKTEPVTRDMEISMSTNINSLDPAKLVMPATKVNETASANDKFQSQGKKQVGNKASGTVKIFNFTHLPLNLKAATTVLTVGSKTYNLVTDISGLKPTAYKNAKTKEVDPSTLAGSIEVVASSGGQDFNLPAGTRMEITNQVFGSKPQLLYAKTDTEITGGTTRYVSIISQDDINAAKASLQDQVLGQVRAKLKSADGVLADKAFTFEVTQFTTDNPVGAETPSFSASMQAKINGLAFKQQDLKNIISQRIGQTLAANKTLRPKQPESTSYKVKSFDPNSELSVLSVHFEGQAVFDINLSNIAPELVGKSQSEVNEILRSKAQIDKVEITLAPAWQKNFPLFASKISVNMAQDEQGN